MSWVKYINNFTNNKKMTPENVKTNTEKIQYLKAVYGINQDNLFNKIISEIIEDEITEAYGGESQINQHDLDYIRKRINLLFNQATKID
jgi:hypothetical protein